MNYLEAIFDNIGDAAVTASERYLDSIVADVGTKEAPIKSSVQIEPVVEPKDYSGLFLIGGGLVAVLTAFLIFRKGKK